mgnify:CR=1 FL=1
MSAGSADKVMDDPKAHIVVNMRILLVMLVMEILRQVPLSVVSVQLSSVIEVMLEVS